MDKTLILNELKRYKNFRTDKEFADFLGITPQGLSKWYERNFYDIEKMSIIFPEVSAEWLLRGDGNMLRNAIPLEYKTDDKQEHLYVGESEDPFYGHLKKAPLIPIDIIRKQHIRVWDYVQRHKELYEMFPGNLMPDFDLIHIVRSNALQPSVEKGDILFLEHLDLSADSVVNGHIYFIDTKMNGIVIKKVFVEDGKLTCYSLRNNVPVKRFSVDDIFDIFSIVSVLKFSIPNTEQVDMHIKQIDKLLDSTHEVVAQNSALIEEVSAQRKMVERLIERNVG